MGKDSILTEEQKLVFEKLGAENYIKTHFYFTGGTALSEVYLKHRLSEDLDFFSSNKFDTKAILSIISGIASGLKLTMESQKIEETNIYMLNFPADVKLKVDFALYPYRNLKEGVLYKGIEIDSKFDIAVNKLLLVGSQREEVKDYVDLYFLLKEFNIWDLIDGVKVKFNVKLEPYLLASDFLAVQDFTYLPKMLIPLEMKELKDFYIGLSNKLGAKEVSP